VRNLVFIPGAAGDSSFWAPVAGRLPDDWQHQFLESPASGAGPWFDTGVGSYADLADRVADSIAGEADLIAQSLGCVLAVQIAVQHPGKVRRLVLAGMSAGIDTVRLGGPVWTDGFAARHPALPEWIIGTIPDQTAALPTLTAPTLLIWGSRDAVSPVAVGRAVHELIPRSRFEVVEGGEHDFPAKFVDATASLILRQLEQPASGP
jgi:pimeloyl-ACP methyl ester carboxylesterase